MVNKYFKLEILQQRVHAGTDDHLSDAGSRHDAQEGGIHERDDPGAHPHLRVPSDAHGEEPRAGACETGEL